MLLLLITFLIIHYGVIQLEKYIKDARKYPEFFDCVNTLTGLLLFCAVAAILGNKWLLYSTSLDFDISFKIDIRYLHIYHIPIFIPIHVGISKKMLALHAFVTFCVFVYIVYITLPRNYAHRYPHIPHEKRMGALLNDIRNILIKLFLLQIVITIVPDIVLGFIGLFPKKLVTFTISYILKHFVKHILKFLLRYPLPPLVRFYRRYEEPIEFYYKGIIRLIKIYLTMIFLLLQHGIRLQNHAMFRLLYLSFIPYASYWNLCIKYMVFPWAVVFRIYATGGILYAFLLGFIEYLTDPDYFFFCIRDFFLWAFYPGGDVPGDPGDPNNDHMNRR